MLLLTLPYSIKTTNIEIYMQKINKNLYLLVWKEYVFPTFHGNSEFAVST